MTTPKSKYVCEYCLSEHVTCDACAAWNAETQAWELVSEYDNTDCQECGGECGTLPVPADVVCISKYEELARLRGWDSDDDPGDHDVSPTRGDKTASSWLEACSVDNLTLDDYEFEMNKSRVSASA
jgi:hypothetical protein